ncbi:MAG: phosphate ABC transporter permease PstA [Rhodospirillaceae bacterium]|nr:phosphate ABC transporter permease PstA [Rhodospirillaceae bacterium]
MSDVAQVQRIDLSSPETSARLRRRHAAERRFRAYGVVAIALSIAFLLILFTTIVSNAYTALVQTHIRLTVDFDAERIDPHGTGDPEVILAGDFSGVVKSALRERFPDVKGRRDRRSLYAIVSPGAAFDLQKLAISNPELVGTSREIWLVASDDVDMLLKGFIPRDVPESDRRINDKQIGWVDALIAEEAVERKFNTRFFTAGDSREPELAGVLGAVAGSFFTMAVTLILAFPLGVATAVYMQEFAPKNRWTDLIEVNINNLAAVPSIVFGLLGLAVFLNVLHLPRSAPVVGGIVLALMTLPTIIIAGRAALGAVPPSIREAALGIGASRMQATFHHVLPLAMPGILSGTIIGMARALGETAPLLMIGMVAFIVDVPKGPFDPATVLPVQVFLWADSPERAFVERLSAAIVVLLVFLVLMNAAAIYLRKRFERRW